MCNDEQIAGIGQAANDVTENILCWFIEALTRFGISA
jgi:hypothetical protein